MMTATPKEFFLEEIARIQEKGGTAALAPLWTRGKALFETMDFPTVKEEAWRNTNIKPLLTLPFTPIVPTAVAPDAVARCIATLPMEADDLLLVTINGTVASEYSRLPLSSLAFVGGLQEALQSKKKALVEALLQSSPEPRHAFTALNEACARDGAVVLVKDNQLLSHPLHILSLSSSATDARAIHERLLVHVGRNASATIAIHHRTLEGRSVIFKTFVEDCRVQENASLTRLENFQDPRDFYRIDHLSVEQKKDSRFNSFSLALDCAKITRNEIVVALKEPGCESNLYGMALNTERNLLDNDLLIEHQAPSSRSRMRYKQLLKDSSRGVFTGKIYVDKIAQETNSEQLSANILLSPQARMDAKPQLEIYADDVRCTHGVTIGRPDPAALFYLRSRGIGAHDAMKLLSFGFAEDLITAIPVPTMREWFSEEFWKRIQLAV